MTKIPARRSHLRVAVFARCLEQAAIRGVVTMEDIRSGSDFETHVQLRHSERYNEIFAGVDSRVDFAYAERMMLFWACEADRLAKEGGAR